MAKKCARTFSIVVEKGKKSILEVRHLLPDALPRSVRGTSCRGQQKHQRATERDTSASAYILMLAGTAAAALATAHTALMRQHLGASSVSLSPRMASRSV